MAGEERRRGVRSLSDERLLVSVHQPLFLPWAGFWNKLLNSDLHIVYAGAKFDQGNYQHRVLLSDDNWLTMPVAKHQRNRPIKDVRLADGFNPDGLIAKLTARFRGHAVRRKDRFEAILDGLDQCRDCRYMLDVDVKMLKTLMGLFGFQVPIIIDDTEPEGETKTERLDALLAKYAKPPFVYLSGAGAKVYMSGESLINPDQTLFQKVNEGVSPYSIVEAMLWMDDPLSYVMGVASWE